MPRQRSSSPLLFVVTALLLPLGVTAEEPRIGTEFQVNTYTSGDQRDASVAMDGDGDFVVTWSSSGQDGYGFGVFARRFASTGDPLASEFQVSTYTLSELGEPSVAADADGDFVVAWESRDQDGSDDGVFARRFASTGDALASEFQVATYTTGAQYLPSVAADADGDFVVAWLSYEQDGYGYGVFARRFSSSGDPLASEFQVATYTDYDQGYPSVAVDADGDFVIVWQDNGRDSSNYDVFARRFSSAGNPLAAEFLVNTYTANYQRFPAAAADADGNFVVAWQSYGQDGYRDGIFARRFSGTGDPLASEFMVNTYTSNNHRVPSIAADVDGDFVVAWETNGQDGSQLGIFGRSFSSAGAALTAEFQVNTHTTQSQQEPSVGTDDNGDFVVAWWSGGQDGSNTGIFAQRFAAASAITLDVDGNASVEPLTDGLLVLRYLFGFTGTTLTSGAVGGGCTRCDAAAIESYLGGLGLVLDIDGNGAVEPLTDGLLVLRYLFGFTGTTLTSGAVGAGCTRCDAAAIETYLAGLTS